MCWVRQVGMVYPKGVLTSVVLHKLLHLGVNGVGRELESELPTCQPMAVVVSKHRMDRVQWLLQVPMASMVQSSGAVSLCGAMTACFQGETYHNPPIGC